MANMTFLATFYGGTPSIVDAGGAAAHTATGVTYAAAEHFAGEQGVVIDGTDVLKTTAEGTALAAQVPPTTGSAAVWFRPDAAMSGLTQTVVSINSIAGSAGDMIWLRIDGVSNQFVLRCHGNGVAGGGDFTISTGVTPSVGDPHFGYADWDGSNVLVEIDGTEQTGTRGTINGWYHATNGDGIGIGMYPRTNNLQLNGMIEAVAFFDAPLTTAERDFLRTSTAPWTFGMTMEPPSDPPVVSAGADAAVAQYALWTQAGSFTDADSSSWTATVDYDDGSGAVPLALSGQTFSLSHTYSSVGVYTVTVTVDDGEGGIGSDTVQVTVSEEPPSDPPIVNAGADATIYAGATFTRIAPFTDADSTSWTATADYGEGAGPVVATVDQVNKTVALSNVYESIGVYIVTVTVDDGEGGIGSDTVQVTVTEAPTIGQFVIVDVVGTDVNAPTVILNGGEL